MAAYPDEIQVSLHGRRLGLDKDDHLLTKGVKLNVTAESTSVVIPRNGISTLSTTTASYTLESPLAGVRKVISVIGATSAARAVTLVAGAFASSGSSTSTIATFSSTSAVGQALSLVGLSTALWLVEGNHGPAVFS